ncbi:MAG TPA: phosphatidate cytidylyltransferase [Nitrospiraceae bacterium]|nr:phosphatidate cytidylyltransferase [Nitrospiraceae bacterium]
MKQGAVECGGEGQQPVETLPSASKRLDIRRIYPALIFAPLFYVLVRYLPPSAFFSLVLTASLLATGEFYRLHFRTEQGAVPIVAGVGATALLLTSMQWPDLLSEQTVLLLTVVGSLLLPLFSQRDLSRALMDSAVLAFGVLYVGFTIGHLLRTRALDGGEFLVFFVVLTTWAGDTGAYYVGTLFGRRKLTPTISPNKTVEGLIGGVACSVLTAFGARAWFLPSLTTVDCVALGLLMAGVGLAGDLVESALKRSAGVKDSGGLLPGHGGMLDRLDSLLFTAPAFYYYVTLGKGY